MNLLPETTPEALTSAEPHRLRAKIKTADLNLFSRVPVPPSRATNQHQADLEGLLRRLFES